MQLMTEETANEVVDFMVGLAMTTLLRMPWYNVCSGEQVEVVAAMRSEYRQHIDSVEWGAQQAYVASFVRNDMTHAVRLLTDLRFTLAHIDFDSEDLARHYNDVLEHYRRRAVPPQQRPHPPYDTHAPEDES